MNPFNDAGDKHKIVDRLCYSLAEELEDNTIIMSTAIVATSLLTNRHGLLMNQLVDSYDWIRDEIMERGGWIDPILEGSNIIVPRALKILGANSIERKANNKNFVTPVNKNQFLNQDLDRECEEWMKLRYYSNQLLHIFKEEGILCVALASFGLERIGGGRLVEKGEFWERVGFLRGLLKREFIPRGCGNDEEEDLYYEKKFWYLSSERKIFILNPNPNPLNPNPNLNDLINDKNSEYGIELNKSQMRLFSFLTHLIWPLLDSYYIISLTLFTSIRNNNSAKGELEDSILDRGHWIARRMIERNELEYKESGNRDAMRNGLREFWEKGIVEERGGGVGGERRYGLGRGIGEREVEEWCRRIGRFRKGEIWGRGEGGVRGRGVALAMDYPVQETSKL
eukprot:TRINITY_DN5569_c3_g3_i1.p1 TRINITY_DN5569_c3_g3~~TRINITY_DN5569_c3_g3_i1.p1  ORF type:complete len:433 (-),score=160.51 TRINITY_DN5569_c3_g3_i1:147-1334(-)